ncbi:MAG: molecular chaperone DnaJ [candidate division WS1 bacterium]|nr:molecular chaperone DnaJ [candidate division WS1 bacterium]
MPDDYYQVLGVSRDCSQTEIKQAYRRLARRYHPDVCREDGAEDRFKAISNAYATLSDAQKRQRYDMYGENGSNGAAGRPADIFDIFNQVFGGMGGPFGAQAQNRGADLQYEVTLDLQGVVDGFEAELSVQRQTECEQCGGSGAAPGSSPITCVMCAGRGVVAQERATLLGVMTTTSTCPRCHGRGVVIADPCPGCSGRGVTRTSEEVLVTIPPGIEDGQRIRMAGHGDVPAGGGIPGDLLIRVRVQRHPDFVRRERDLLMNLDISFVQAALGDTVTVPTLGGEKEITIQPGAQSGDLVELDGLGLPPLHGGRRGRQIVNLRVVTPTDLDDDQRALLMQFGLQRGEDVRPPEHRGLFDRLRRVLGGEA